MLPGGLELGSIFEDLPPRSKFTMTAGARSATEFTPALRGFHRDLSAGSISPDAPIFGAPLEELCSFHSGLAIGSGRIRFDGDITSELAGKYVYVNGVKWDSTFSGWVTQSGDTRGTWTSIPSAFDEFASYLIEIR